MAPYLSRRHGRRSCGAVPRRAECFGGLGWLARRKTVASCVFGIIFGAFLGALSYVSSVAGNDRALGFAIKWSSGRTASRNLRAPISVLDASRLQCGTSLPVLHGLQGCSKSQYRWRTCSLAALGAVAAAALAQLRSRRRGGLGQCRVRAEAGNGLRVFGISDLHTDEVANLDFLTALPVGPFLNDVLLVAGDVSQDSRIFSATMRILRDRFGYVLFVPGNHDVWLDIGTSPSGCAANSLSKHRWLLEECSRVGVWTSPIRFPSERLIVVPLLSWYHAEFDSDTEKLPQDVSISDRLSRQRARNPALGDVVSCSWPASIGTDMIECDDVLAHVFDTANDYRVLQDFEALESIPESIKAVLPSDVCEEQVMGTQMHNGAQPISFEDAVAGSQCGETVISFSHFLPRLELLPEKRFLYYPKLAQSAGSLPLSTRVSKLQPTLHLFGHTHFAWDMTCSDGVRYVQAPLGYSKEWITRPRSLRLEGGLPTLLWRGRSSDTPFPAQRSALWSDYYACTSRQPHNHKVAPWLRSTPRRSRHSPQGFTEEQSMRKASSGEATLCVLWDLDQRPTFSQRSLLSNDEQARAATFQSVKAEWRFVWARAALRCLLGEKLGVHPKDIKLSVGADGKPRVDSSLVTGRCEFSVSHSDDVGVILITVGRCEAGSRISPVGVDVERHRKRPFDQLGRRFFSLEDCRALDGVSGQEKSNLFFEMWTKKEAWLKAVGVGLAGGLASLPCGEREWLTVQRSSFAQGIPETPYTIVSLTDKLPGLDGYSLAVAQPLGLQLRFESLSSVGWPHLLLRTDKLPRKDHSR